MVIKSSDLTLRPEISEAFKLECARIDKEIEELKRKKQEIVKIIEDVDIIGRNSYMLMQEQGETAAQKFAALQLEGHNLKNRVIDLRGYCDFYRELEYRHVDLWVTLKK